MRDRLGAWFGRHPLATALFAIGMGGSSFALLLERLREVLEILDVYVSPGAGRESVLRGVLWAISIAAMFAIAGVVQRTWWKKSRLRTWVLGALVLPPILALLATAPDRGGDPPGAGFCRSWQCVASSYVVWLGVAVAFAAIGLLLATRVFRGRHSRLHALLRGFSGPTGRPCRTTVTALPRDQDAVEEGWVYFSDCACGVVGPARSSPEEAAGDACEHAPDQAPVLDIPPEAKPGPAAPHLG